MQVSGGGGGGSYNANKGLGKSGGGDGESTSNLVQNGVANTGGGGGGGAASSLGGNGGSGVLYLKYPVANTATFSGGVTQTTTTIGSFKHVKITAAGPSDTVTFG
ncbi:hypothetical protein OAW32_02565 [bacterium]|nr:hypothetical protein [bacterium]